MRARKRKTLKKNRSCARAKIISKNDIQIFRIEPRGIKKGLSFKMFYLF